MEEKGIVQSKEALVGFVKLAALLAASFKDGVQAADIAVIIAKIQGDVELQKALIAAYNDIEQVGGEVKDISLPEAIELVIAVLPEINNLVVALKK